MYAKILVPLDGSKLAEAPLRYAAWLAKKSGAELVLMYVYRGRAPLVSSYLGRKIEWIMHQNRFQDGTPVNVVPVAVAGDPANEILRYSEDNNVSLITMSTHGRTGIKRWLMGSVADRVVRYSNRPVRLVKSFGNILPENTDFDSKVLALLDGSEMAERVLPYAAYHARLSGGELTLMSVCEPPEIVPAVTYHLIPPHGYPAARPPQWEKYVERETQQRQRECRLYLDKQVELNADKEFSVKIEAPLGNPAEEIIRYLETKTVNLVAMTTRGRSGLSRLVFGSVAEKVLLASPCPVLIIKPG